MESEQQEAKPAETTEPQPTQSSEGEAPAKKTGGKMKNTQENNPDDTISVQMQNTKAQVLGAWKKVSSSIQKAGKKVTGAFGSKDKTKK